LRFPPSSPHNPGDMTQQRKRRLAVLSAFTGVGGLDLGLEAAGFRTIACIENDANARMSIRSNRPDWKVVDPPDIARAARSLQPGDLALRKRQLDLLAGGPPCQPFSKAAQWSDWGRKGLRDPRAKCLGAFLKLAETFLPRIILIENVPGFARGRTSSLHVVRRALTRINHRCGTRYRLEWRILNAADYGVPQRRERAILVARRDGKGVDWPPPTHRGEPLRAYDALADVPSSELPKAGGYWTDLLRSIPEGLNYQFLTPEGGGTPVFGRRRRYWSFLLKLAKDKPAWTIPARPGPSTGPFHWDNRPLAIKELLRLQSFPKSWRVRGGRIAQVRQIGNATPPLLAEVVGRALSESVFGLRSAGPLVLKIRRRRSIPTAVPAEPVPAKYRKHIARHAAHPGAGLGPGARKRRLKTGKQPGYPSRAQGGAYGSARHGGAGPPAAQRDERNRNKRAATQSGGGERPTRTRARRAIRAA
jgi:DNA (cytosine-5)-methyltransferase 1